MKQEMTKEEKIKFIKNYISTRGTTANLERLLYRMEHEGVLQIDLIPDEIYHDLIKSNVSSIPPYMAPKLQREYPEYDWSMLAANGRRILDEMEVTS
jgi:hypothetical protein